jgi:hypothetical protein
MKKIKLLIASLLAATFALTLSACVTDKHTYASQPQKIVEAVKSKYPEDKNTLIFIDAPQGFIAPRFANCEVENGVDNGKVVAIASALALKTNTVVVAGEDESLTASTLAKAMTMNKAKNSGAKAIVIGAMETKQKLTDLAAYNDVALEFMDNPK